MSGYRECFVLKILTLWRGGVYESERKTHIHTGLHCFRSRVQSLFWSSPCADSVSDWTRDRVSFCQMLEQVHILKCNVFQIVKCIKLEVPTYRNPWVKVIFSECHLPISVSSIVFLTVPVISQTEAIKASVNLPWLNLFTYYFSVLVF